MYGSRVNGAVQVKELHPPQHLSVVAIEKGDFESPSITIVQVHNYIYIYIYMCVCVYIYIYIYIY